MSDHTQDHDVIRERFEKAAAEKKTAIEQVEFTRFSVRSLFSNVDSCLKQACKYNQQPARTTAILDLGCGTGNYYDLLRKYYPDSNLTAVDVVSSNVQYCLQRGYEQGKVFNIIHADRNFAENEFDLVFSVEVIEYISPADYDLLFSGIHKLLKPGGLVVLIFPNLQSLIRKLIKPSLKDFPFNYGFEDIRKSLDKNRFTLLRWFATDLTTAITLSSPTMNRLLSLMGFRLGMLLLK
jgi:SAM-dependent methyltransferase